MSDTIEFSIPIDNDEHGFFGRKCPNDECHGYFKVELGTGLQGQDLPCHCPYCGHTDSHDHFWTQDQLEYVQSVGMLKDAFPPTRPRPGDFISVSWKVKPGTPLPLHHYKEKKLETTVVCDACGLRYAVYGVFAYCPDCGSHNSLQILVSNLDLASRELELASTITQPLAGQLVSDALENAVAAFDAFARELFRVNADLSSSPPQAESLSGQNLTGLKTRVEELFGIDLSSPFDTDEWTNLVRAFQKRHLIAHKMGVIDDAYIAGSGDPGAVKGRKVALSPEEVAAVLPLVRRLGEHVQAELKRLPPEGVGA